MKKVIAAGMVGNGMEWYDFALYGQMATVIGVLFFPSGDPSVQLLASFGVFAVGFIARPFGGIVFGWLGDRFGRRRALTVSILMMAACTAVIGLLPTYAQIGVWAPILLTLVRLVQGLSVGGEFSGAITYMVEHAPAKKRGIVGSTTMFSTVLGFLAGSLVSAMFAAAMPEEAFLSWGWRVPFLIGIALGLVGFYIRSHCEESPIYEEAKREGNLSSKPVRDALLHHPIPMLRAIGIYFLVTMPFYMVSIYFIALNKKELGLTLQQAMALNAISMLAMLVCVPVAALLSDRYGRRPVMLTLSAAFLALSYPLFSLFVPSSLTEILIGQTIFAALIGLYIGPVPAILSELFPTRVRYTGMAISYNIAAAVFGGTAPIVGVWLMESFHDAKVLAFYVMTAALSAFAAVYPHRDRHGQKLH